MRREAEKPVVVIALITAVCLLGDTMLYVVLPIYWKSFGLTALWQVGVLLSINRLVRLPLNPFVGWLYHRISKRTGVLIAVGLSVITTCSYGFFSGFWLLFFMRCLWGVSWAFLRLGGFLTILEVANQQNHGFLIGKYNGLWGLGGLAGMLIGGFLVDLIGIEAVTFIFAAAALLNIPFVIRYVPDNVSDYEKRDESGRSTFKQVWKPKMWFR
ncbi:MFS transporter [Thalassobacillus sp. CUG 92003]|uniref:MFS transporter n=1 Tax=Thalassobacillus sp. CUG 92003 TaxID=2736641 RepID=UPI0015E73287|nr:MFS transporter [Thalassobacillus sp. CUG 92003]